MPSVGTLAWASATGGRIGLRDRVVLARTAAALLVVNLPSIVMHRLGLTRRFPPTIDLAALEPPDTRAATAAETLLTELTPPFMINHSLRTYWFGRLLGLAAQHRFDDEALYVASLLHDLGFYGRYATATSDAECFAIRSARAAYDVLGGCGWERQRQDRVAEAIILHVNGDVPVAHGLEAFLLERGVMLDVTGLHAWHLHPTTVAEVFARHPRLDQRAALWPTFSGEAEAHPACRGYFAKRYLQFGLLVRFAPWG